MIKYITGQTPQKGDVVKISDTFIREYVEERFEGEAILKGLSVYSKKYIALERLDGKPGGAQNGWWNFRKIDINKLILTKREVKNSSKTMKITIEKYLKIAKMSDLVRTNGDGAEESFDEHEGTVIKIFPSHFVMKLTGEAKSEWNVSIPAEGEEIWVEVLQKSDGLADLKVKKLDIKKKKIYITIEKEKNQVILTLKLPEEIENYYKEASKGNTKKSGCWFKGDGSPAEFYVLTEELEKYERNLDTYSFSDYGTGLFSSGRYNTAILRTLGAAGKVMIKSENFNIISNMELEDYVRRLGLFVKRLWETTISKQKIKSIISYEI